MRLGKTPQILYWLKKHPNIRPVVVVCPATAKWEWEAQAWEHIKIKGLVLEGRKGKLKKSFRQKISVAPLIIINYDILSSWVNYLKSKVKPRAVVLDECHYIKNRRAKRTRAARKLARKARYRFGLSGTPLVNRPAELFPSLNIIRPDLYPSFLLFAYRYCNPKSVMGKLQFKGAKNLGELHSILCSELMIRRLRKDVWKELPKKERKIVPLDIENKKEYRKAQTDLIAWMVANRLRGEAKKANRALALVKWGYLKRIAAELKLKSIVQWLEDFLEESDDKIIVYGIHKKILKPLHKKFKRISVIVDGSVKGRDRKKAIRRFQTKKKFRIFFGNIIAAGTAISLSKASAIAFVELDWTPGNHTQAEDRMIDFQSYNLPQGGYLDVVTTDGISSPKTLFSSSFNSAFSELSGSHLRPIRNIQAQQINNTLLL